MENEEQLAKNDVAMNECNVTSAHESYRCVETLNDDVNIATNTITNATASPVTRLETEKLEQLPASNKEVETAPNSISSAPEMKPQNIDSTATAKTLSGRSKKTVVNSYYYWHGHEKERAKVGDVAPLPTPVLVKRVEERLLSPVITTIPINKYSWSDDDKIVIVYIETGHNCTDPNLMQKSEQSADNYKVVTEYNSTSPVSAAPTATVKQENCEILERNTVDVKFTTHTCEVTFITRALSKGNLERKKRLLLHLSNKIKPAESSYKVKSSLKEIVVKLSKAHDGTWFDLTGNAQSSSMSSSASSSSSSSSLPSANNFIDEKNEEDIVDNAV